jgi:hypothetical protein
MRLEFSASPTRYETGVSASPTRYEIGVFSITNKVLDWSFQHHQQGMRLEFSASPTRYEI